MDDDEFLARIEAHLAKTKISASRFGKEAVGDPSFVFELRNGRSPRLININKVIAIIEAPNAAPAPEPVS